MTSPVKLSVATPHAVFFGGEPILVRVRITTDVNAAPVDVPSPFEPFQPGVKLLVMPADREATSLDSSDAAAGRTAQLPPGDLREAELVVSRVYDFKPGHYEVSVEWTPRGMAALRDTASFDVVEPAAMTLALGELGGIDAPGLRAVGTVSGAGLGVLLELEFAPDIEDDTHYVCARSEKRLVQSDPLKAAIPVRSVSESAAWCASRDATGLFARSGFEMQGVARSDWPRDDVPHVVVPAIEQGDGLSVFTVTRGGQLASIEFAPPQVAIEEPTEPDDWDDEVLLPGPVTQSQLGTTGDGILGARAVVLKDALSIVLVARGALLHASVMGRALAFVTRVELDARILSTDPALTVVSDGTPLVAVVVARETSERPDLLEVGLALWRLDDGAPEFRWLGELESVPVAASVSFAPGPDGAVAALCAVLDTEHLLHVGTWAGSWAKVAAPSTLLSPLVITAALGAAHVAVATPEGPRLQRL